MATTPSTHSPTSTSTACGPFAGVRFSRVGTLIATAESFVNHAEAGYFVDELDNLLAVGTQDPLHKLVSNGRLTRHKLAGPVPLLRGRPRAPSPTNCARGAC